MKRLLTVEKSDDFRRIVGHARTMLHPPLSGEARYMGEWDAGKRLVFKFPDMDLVYVVARYVETDPFPAVEVDADDGFPRLVGPIGGHVYHGHYSPWRHYNRLPIAVNDDVKTLHIFGSALNTREVFFRDGDGCFHVQVCKRFADRLISGRRSPGKISFWINNGVRVDQAKYGRKYGNEIQRIPQAWSLCNWDSGPMTEKVIHLDHWDIHVDDFDRVMYVCKK